MNTSILIPARYNSTRFVGKPLTTINGERMVARAVRIAQQSAEASSVKVLTDSMKIIDAVPKGIGWLDDGEYRNGTERAAAYAANLPSCAMVAILQGDEVTITGRDLDYALSKAQPHMVTTITARVPGREPTDDDVFVRTNTVGTVVEFKRGDASLGYHHVGVYITSAGLLKQYAKTPATSGELHERLEQHRWEAVGVSVQAVYLPIETQSVNRREDVADVERLICQNASTLVGVPESR